MQWTQATELKAVPIDTIQAFQVKLLRCTFNNKNVMSLREFKKNGQPLRLIVEEQSLKTSLVAVKDLQACQPLNLNKTSRVYSDPKFASRYLQALKHYNTFTGGWQNHGLTHETNKKNGSFLTIDLCPSSHPIDKALFEKFRDTHWPVGIAVSGLWILKHEIDWQWLKTTLAQTPVTWINHSRNHPVQIEVPIEKNFLLLEGRDIYKEILENEILLIQRGITPSIFFRFPGLVANEQALAITQGLGLIPLGSNAWLSKGESPKPGSIVLLHGNGNDPKGINLFFSDLEKKQFSEPFKGLLDLNF